MRRFWARYRWVVIVSLLAYAAATLWLLLATGGSDTAPFEYQIF